MVLYKNAFYGTTLYHGGSEGDGTVFKVTPSGKETVLHRFGGTPDGALAFPGLTVHGKMLYGTTELGGSKNLGTVFKMTAGGKLTVIHNFGATKGDGVEPVAGLLDVNGTLYGTTLSDVTVGEGTVYSITPAGAESQIAVFCPTPTCAAGSPSTPEAGVIDVNGMLYGTTLSQTGPYGGSGTVFAVPI